MSPVGQVEMAQRSPGPVKVALHYGKTGRLRWASPRVMQRVFERLVRRASVPIAYSAGFTPHPRLSYLTPAPTGAESQAEYLLMRLAAPGPLDQITAAMNQAAPEGLSVFRAVSWPGRDLAERLEASLWRVYLPGLDQTQLADATAKLMALEECLVVRPASPLAGGGPGRPASQNHDRPVVSREVRGAIVSLRLADDGGERAGGDSHLGAPGHLRSQFDQCGILDVTVRHTTPAVRPDDVVTALAEAAGLAANAPPRFSRLAQGLLRGNAGSLQDPLSRS